MEQIVALLKSDLDVLINPTQISSATPTFEGIDVNMFASNSVLFLSPRKYLTMALI